MKNTLYMLNSVTGTQMNSFIITTKDGKVMVMDGGFNQDAENMIKYLKDITGQNTPHVDAWFLSHPHQDHISCFLEIIEKYPNALDIDKVYYNFPSVQFIDKEQRGCDPCLPRFYADLPLFADKCVILSLGDTVDVGDAHVACLYSPNPELVHNVANNASVVLMLTLGGKKLLFLGDAGVEEGERMLSFYAGTDQLKADYVQMAHHGQNGVEKNFYEAVGATACLWCTPKWLWDNDAGKGYNTHCFKTIVVQGWMADLGVREHYIMMNGTQVVDL